MAEGVLTVSVCALAGITGFVFGAFFQHEVTIRNLVCLIKTDPYVYHHRHKLYYTFSMFKEDVEDRIKYSAQPKLRDYFMMPLFSMCSFFFIMPPARLHKTTNLPEIMKYGFPGIEEIEVCKDYVVSYDVRNNAAHWICEHLTSKLDNHHGYDSTGQGKSGLNLRFNDVYVLSNGTSRMGCVFKTQIWRRMEEYISHLTEKYGSVYVYTGPLYLPKGQTDDWSLEFEVLDWVPVPVPSHFFKVIIVDSQLEHCSPYMEGYIIPNTNFFESTNLREYLSEIDEIESYSGLKFERGLRHNVLFKNENYNSESDSKLAVCQDLETRLNLIDSAFVYEIY